MISEVSTVNRTASAEHLSVDPTCDHALLDASVDLLPISKVMGRVHPLTTLLACSSGLC